MQEMCVVLLIDVFTCLASLALARPVNLHTLKAKFKNFLHIGTILVCYKEIPKK